MRELSKQKPRAKNDDALMAEITKYESEIMIVQDELVNDISSFLEIVSSLFSSHRAAAKSI
jgi:hypothetical protein